MTGDPIEIYVSDEQSLEIPLESLRGLAYHVLMALEVRTPVELSLLFVDEPAIATLNERFRGTQGSTDVLSFAVEQDGDFPGMPQFPGNPGASAASGFSERPQLLGDVVICPEVAARNAPARAGDRGHRGTLADELALLVVHGILHIRGLDHEDVEEAQVMEAKEAELLSSYYSSRKGL